MSNTVEIKDFETLLDEALFVEWADYLCYVGRLYADTSLPVVIWANAKHHAIGILNSKKPALAFSNRCVAIRKQYSYDEKLYTIVVLCVYTMVCLNANKEAYEQLQAVKFIDYSVRNIDDRVADIIFKIGQHQITIDYDYSKTDGKLNNNTLEDQSSTSLSEYYLQKENQKLQRQIERLNVTIKELIEANDKKIESLAESDAIEPSDDSSEGLLTLDPKNKLRLKMAYRGLKAMGANISNENRGSKAATARLLCYITGIDHKNCEEFCSKEFRVDIRYHKDDIAVLQNDFKAIGINDFDFGISQKDLDEKKLLHE